MAPEQAKGLADDVEPATDIFALGGILYTVISGRRPFSAPSVPALLRRLCDEEPLPIDDLRTDVPAGVADVLAIAMAKAKDQRYTTATELANDLAAAVAGMPHPSVAARAAGVERARPASRRMGGTPSATRDAVKVAMAETYLGDSEPEDPPPSVDL